MRIAITLVAAMLLGTGWVLQQHAAEQAPQAHFLKLRLISDLLHRPRWLAGIAVMVLGQATSAYALGHLDLSLAEPLLATNLIFALALAVPLSGQRLQPTELIGAVILGGGVAALSVSRSAGPPTASFGSYAAWWSAAVIAGVAYCFVHAGHLRSGQLRATLTGAGAGLVLGISDALTRRAVQLLDHHGIVALLSTWPGYSVIGASVIGVWLMQSAFNAGPLHASLPAIAAAEPFAGILLGIVVFGDVVSTSPAMIAVQVIGLTSLVVGVVLVARAPVLGSLRPHPHLPHAHQRGQPASHQD
jgi:drug/metabolite transporter (DMT)-like permease